VWGCLIVLRPFSLSPLFVFFDGTKVRRVASPAKDKKTTLLNGGFCEGTVLIGLFGAF